MKKRIYSILFLAILAAVMLTACAKQAAASTDPSPEEELEQSPVQFEDSEQPEPIPLEEESPETQENLPVDRASLFLCDEEYAKTHDGYYILKGDKLYGVTNPKGSGDRPVWHGLTTFAASEPGILQMIDTEIPKLSPGDLFICYKSSGDIEPIYVLDSWIMGYATSVIPYYNYNKQVDGFDNLDDVVFYSDGSSVSKTRYDKSTVFYDKDGNELNDYIHLNKDEIYKIGTFTGTTYAEIELPANHPVWHFYNGFHYEDDYVHKFEGELTKNGYAVYDLSSLEPGLYQFWNDTAYFEITE